MFKNEVYLYLVVIGGRLPKANIELHDVRWVLGSKIEDTFGDLRKGWFGSIDGLHIDSYKKIYSVDGYKIKLKKSQNKKSKINLIKKTKDSKKLWFINLGGYDPKSMQEKHEFGLVVASNASDAKKLAKSKWLNGFKKKHNDDIDCLQRFSDVDDCKLIKNINNWEIELMPKDVKVVETNYPDWFGYLRIDNK
ncbi:DUF1543 domain-containing protein [Prochlorococcus marinus]|uniref:DUF1543 domain-containing protein n=1 Tax=Prochlorococcus marinus TaxID=1219 RepID=UPI001ADC276A|nr:DUF1543 domain-containing protein [Prochlorococcus marinus]MBO8219721.1 DUF1543 domain-containing protein [Prochlorococcus marinus CUG1416]MBW3052083.1 DUF1543 domain-containing protein [Prochlorococcus marinus str. MU1416]